MNQELPPSAPPPLTVETLPAAKRSLRIAVVTETYPPEINGVALTLQRIVQGLQALNHDIQLIRPRQPQDASAGPPADLVLTRGMPIPHYPKLRLGLPARQALEKLWRVQRPDVVHLATEGPLGWSALRAARKLRLPVTSDFRTNFHAYSQHYGLGWMRKPVLGYLRRFHNHTQHTMVPTEALRDELAKQGFQRLRVVGRGIDTVRFSPAHRSSALRAVWGADAFTPVVLSVGRLAEEKNLDLLLKAFGAMQERQPAARLVVVGDGPARASLQAHCQDAVFAGERRDADLAAHYASADIFLFPSLTETFGNVVPEALASGLAVLAFHHAAAAQLIRNGENGLTVARGNPEGFVQRAVDLVEVSGMAQLLRDNARASMVPLSWEGVAQQVEDVFVEAMAQGLEGAASGRSGQGTLRTWLRSRLA